MFFFKLWIGKDWYFNVIGIYNVIDLFFNYVMNLIRNKIEIYERLNLYLKEKVSFKR